MYLGCDIGGAKELGMIYFPTNWGAKEPQNLPNHRVGIVHLRRFVGFPAHHDFVDFCSEVFKEISAGDAYRPK